VFIGGKLETAGGEFAIQLVDQMLLMTGASRNASVFHHADLNALAEIFLFRSNEKKLGQFLLQGPWFPSISPKIDSILLIDSALCHHEETLLIMRSF
jgi:hypothetical protein